MADASVAFADAISIVTSARASGNMFALTNLSSIVDRLGTFFVEQGALSTHAKCTTAVIDEHNAEATRFSGIAYTCWMSVFVIFTLLPGYFLTRFILARIERYESMYTLTRRRGNKSCLTLRTFRVTGSIFDVGRRRAAGPCRSPSELGT